MEKSYIGKISNKGSQEVIAPIEQPKGKTPKVVTGGDLRAKKSNK